MKEQPTEWQQDMRSQINRKLRELKADGIAAISADNLWQLLRLSPYMEGAPRGTNAAYFARQQYLSALRVSRGSEMIGTG
jgi:hypothetical protein